MKPPTNVVSPFLTVDEAAQYMRQCSRTVQTLCRSGELPARKLGKSWLILRTDLDAYLGIPAQQPAQSVYLRAVE